MQWEKHPNGNWAPSDPVCRPQDIGQAAQLLRVYINYSVCATAITLWSNAGVPNRHIMAISGRRNEQSSAHHNTSPSTAQPLQCSEVLSSHIQGPRLTFRFSNQQSATVIENQHLRPVSCNFDSILRNCTIQNVLLVVSSASPSKWLVKPQTF